MSHHHTKLSRRIGGEGTSDIISKQIIFVRHGHSSVQTISSARESFTNQYLFYRKGQAAPKDRRKTDSSLVDADLSERGLSQAFELARYIQSWSEEGESGPELILSSPLTRAMKTALIVCKKGPMIIHPGLAELNHRRPIPENRGRSVSELLKDDSLKDLGLDDIRVSLDLARDLGWPESSPHDGVDFLRNRKETRIVIFSHHNYISNKLRGVYSGYVENCSPIFATVRFAGSKHSIEVHDTPYSWCLVSKTSVYRPLRTSDVEDHDDELS
jgi:hypothetical protein